MPTIASRQGVSEVVGIILLVAITVVLTGVLYLIVTSLSGQLGEVPPRVVLTNTDTLGGVRTFGVSESGGVPRPFSEFQIRLWIDGVNDNASVMTPIVSGTHGNLTYTDNDRGGTVTTGDEVAVRTTRVTRTNCPYSGRTASSPGPRGTAEPSGCHEL